MAQTTAEALPVQDLSIHDGKQARSEAESSSSSGYATPVEGASEQQSAVHSNAQSSQTSAEKPDSPKGPRKVPFEHPLPSCQPKERPPLTADQETKYANLLKTVRAWTDIPNSTSKLAAKSPITDSERMWLTRECLLRYLRATSWSPTEAPKRLLNTLGWRRDFGVDSLSPDHVSPEGETGKQVILGYDNNARPCLYLNPGRQNTARSDRQIQHLVFMLEREIDMMDAGQDTTALLIDYKGSSTSNSPPASQGRQVLNILQGHYPERLGRACISDLPWYITTFFKLISPFIDPVTREKMVFNQDLRKHVPPSQLDKEHGGDVDFEYDHTIYWPALNTMCEMRRAERKRRWEEAGKQIGEYEAYLRGGDQKPLRDVKEQKKGL
ncbi:MAG: hypothetical protein M1831_006309 [Alyxoria varia]|nr:MAG: hypothetical protein M1831_006309 [Alyxoria varia]